MKLSSGRRSNFNYEQSHDIKPTVKELQLQSEMIESIREQSERRSAELSECRRELATVRASLSLAETGKMAMERENEKLNNKQNPLRPNRQKRASFSDSVQTFIAKENF